MRKPNDEAFTVVVLVAVAMAAIMFLTGYSMSLEHELNLIEADYKCSAVPRVHE